MMYRRYGRFSFCDYISSWLAIVFLFALVVVCFLTDTLVYLFILPLLVLIFMVWSIYEPNSERFLISDDTITITKGRKKQNVFIPSSPTFVISYADVCSSFAKRVNYGNQTFMLKGRYAISILQNTPIEITLAQLHSNYTRKYTNTTLEVYFDEKQYVYSFVGNQEILDKLIANRNCQIIIPESLFNQISIDLHQVNVYIDNGY